MTRNASSVSQMTAGNNSSYANKTLAMDMGNNAEPDKNTMNTIIIKETNHNNEPEEAILHLKKIKPKPKKKAVTKYKNFEANNK